MDLISRKVLGWAVSDSLGTTLMSEAFRQAIENMRPAAGHFLHHGHRGCQYTSEALQKVLKNLQITSSMSRTGDCYANAAAERIAWSSTHEWNKFEDYAKLE